MKCFNRFTAVVMAVMIILCFASCQGGDEGVDTITAFGIPYSSTDETALTTDIFHSDYTSPPAAPLKNLHVDDETLEKYISAAKEYTIDEGTVSAAVIPHHLTGGALITGMLKKLSDTQEYDTIIVVSPNHEGDLADIVYSRSDWENGTLCDRDLLNAIISQGAGGASVTESNARVEEDHSCSALVPFIANYFPKAQIVPLLVSRTLSLDNTIALTRKIYDAVRDSDSKILLLCSIDFSHYLPVELAYINDEQTLSSINQRNLMAIHDLSNEYVDSPASLSVFLQYLTLCGIKKTQVIDHTDASAFMGPVGETTTYFVLCG